MVGQSAGEESLTYARRPDQNQIKMLSEPLPLRPFEELRLAQAPGDLKIDFGQRSTDKKLSLFEPSVQPLILSPDIFTFNDEGKAFIEAEVRVCCIILLLAMLLSCCLICRGGLVVVGHAAHVVVL